MLESIIEESEYNDYLNMGKDMALSHHERYDGKGYPYGLAGDEIPLCARIMAVADVYDALVSHRIYRDETSHITACATIAEGRGTQFDPDIVDVFLRVEKQFEAIVDKLREDMKRHAEENERLGLN
jgi:putative two-component system response regulator